MSLLPPCKLRPGQVPMIHGSQQRYIPKQQEMSHLLTPNSQNYNQMENWVTTDSASTVPCHSCYQLNPWSMGMTQGYSPSHSHTSMANHSFDFSASQPSEVPVTMASHYPGQLKLEQQNLSSCNDPMNWQPEKTVVGLAPSPAFSTPSYHSFYLGNSSSSPINLDPDRDEMRAGCSTDEEGNTDPPYSLLIYQALSSAPGKKLPLQGIYNWFEKNTEKGKDQNSKGWQNSIRHNLSMNAGFEAVKGETVGKKPINYWRLTDAAIKNGIQSTTRYRKMANQKKTMSSEPPTPQRQRSGAKGGKATKISSKVRIGQDERLSRQRAAPTRRQQKDLYRQSPTSGLPIQEPSPAGAMVHPPVETFDLRHVIGCTDYSPTTPIFCDMDATQPDYFGPVNVGSLGWYGIHSLPNGMWTGHEMSTDLPIGV